MSKLHNPFYTAELRGRRLRFFRAPNGVVAMPWHSFADLVTIISPEGAEATISRLRCGPWQDDAQTVDTDEGAVLIAPHWIAQGYIGAMTDERLLDVGFEDAYCEALASAMEALQAGLPLAERLRNAVLMGRRHLDEEDGV